MIDQHLHQVLIYTDQTDIFREKQQKAAEHGNRYHALADKTDMLPQHIGQQDRTGDHAHLNNDIPKRLIGSRIIHSCYFLQISRYLRKQILPFERIS